MIATPARSSTAAAMVAARATPVETRGPPLDPSPQITLVRGTPVGVISPALPIEGATVTYVRAALGDDPAGFFVQAARAARRS